MEDYHKIKCYSTHIDSQQNLQWTDMCKTLPRVQNNKKAQRLFGHESNTVRMFISNIEHSEDLFISFVHISSIFTWALIFCRWSENGVILPQDSFLIMFPLIFFSLYFFVCCHQQLSQKLLGMFTLYATCIFANQLGALFWKLDFSL